MDLGDRVLARVRLVFHGTASGLDAESFYSNIVTYREGLAVFNEFFVDHDQALKAVGLEE